MKVRDLRNGELIVTTSDDFERAYLVDFVGHEVVSVTLVGGRGLGTTEWVTAIGEQHITLEDARAGDAWRVEATRDVGRLIRSLVDSVRTANKRAKDRTEERDAARSELASLRAAIKAPDLSSKRVMNADYDADSTLPLGWSWANVRWATSPDSTVVLVTAVGPEQEMVARSMAGRWFKVGITDKHDGVWASLEKAIIARNEVSNRTGGSR